MDYPKYIHRNTNLIWSDSVSHNVDLQEWIDTEHVECSCPVGTLIKGSQQSKADYPLRIPTIKGWPIIHFLSSFRRKLRSVWLTLITSLFCLAYLRILYQTSQIYHSYNHFRGAKILPGSQRDHSEQHNHFRSSSTLSLKLFPNSLILVILLSLFCQFRRELVLRSCRQGTSGCSYSWFLGYGPLG